MSFSILGLGTAVPPHSMSQVEAAELASQVICQTEEQSHLLAALYRLAGVTNRYTVLPHRMALEWLPKPDATATGEPDRAGGTSLGPTTGERMQFYAEHAATLAQQAAQRAIDEAAIDPRQISHLVTVCCTGFSSPGVDVDLMCNLGLRPTVQRVHVGFMGCHGTINGLRAAHAITTADSAARVLLCAVELCSLHYRFQWDPERIVANALFADGAAAIVAGGEATPVGGWGVAATGSCLLPDSQDAMTWLIGDHGFEMTLSNRVPDLIHAHVRPWLTEWLGNHGHTLESIGSWAIHPGGPRVLSAVEEALALPKGSTAVSREVLREFGNMSSATVLFILERFRRANAAHPCVAIAFGPGLMAEAALFE